MGQSVAGAMKAAARRLGMDLADYEAKMRAGQKWCGGCKAWHPLAAFGADASRRDGRAVVCAESRKTARG